MNDLFSQPGKESEGDHHSEGGEHHMGFKALKSYDIKKQGDTDVSRLFSILERLLDQQVLALEDVEFARWLWERQDEDEPAVLLAAAHLTALTRQGHVGTRIPLAEQQVPLFGHSHSWKLTDNQSQQLKKWKESMAEALRGSDNVGSPDDPAHPMIYDRGYLYYQRYFSYEVELAGRLRELSEQSLQGQDNAFADLDSKKAVHWIEVLLPGDEQTSERREGTRWQRLALWMSLRRQLLVLTGGPGTGKTFTLVRLVALQLLMRAEKEKAEENADDWQVALAAPTGKAAARINESVGESIQSLNEVIPDEIRRQLPTQAQTIHRLLGPRRNHPEFRHNKDNPLPHDVVIVDEASMVDIGLMTKLVEALKPSAQLILIGDKDQLASVEAGSVLGDICTPLISGDSSSIPRINIFLEAFIDQLPAGSSLEISDEHRTTDGSPLLDCMVELTYSRRFRNSLDIGRLAEYVNRNQPDKALDLLQSADQVRISLPDSLGEVVERYNDHDYVDFKFTPENAAEIFNAWGEVQVLCAHRRGRRSAESVNRLMDEEMRRRQLGDFAAADQRWYPGRPVMITENDYELGLFNGDIGITVRDGGQDGQLRVLFEKRGERETEGGYRSVAPTQLSACESAWALTVHKSQGSEYDEVLLVMPARPSPVLTRELIYTALTRARQKFEVWSEESIFKKAIRQQIQRTSALGERIWE